MVRMLGIEGPEPEQIALDHTAAKIPIGLKALLNFAAKLNGQPTKITKRDVDVLRTYGYNDQQIMEAVLMVGLAKFANFVAFGLGTAPDFDPSKELLAHLGVAAGGVG
jgi:alkylhydroperoxidase family enzyme